MAERLDCGHDHAPHFGRTGIGTDCHNEEIARLRAEVARLTQERDEALNAEKVVLAHAHARLALAARLAAVCERHKTDCNGAIINDMRNALADYQRAGQEKG